MIELSPVPQTNGTVVSIACESGLLEWIKADAEVVLRFDCLASSVLCRCTHVDHADPFGGRAYEECGGSVEEGHGCDGVAYTVLEADARVAPDLAARQPSQWRSYRRVGCYGRIVRESPRRR